MNDNNSISVSKNVDLQKATFPTHPATGREPYREIRGWLDSSGGEVSLLEIWHLLLSNMRAILACLVTMVALAVIVSVILPARYEAVVRLTLNSDSQSLPGMDELQSMAMTGGSDTQTKVETQVHILQTDSLAWDVIKQLRLDQNPNFAPQKCRSGAEAPVDKVSPECRHLLLKQFHKRLRVESVPKTEMFELRFRNSDPVLAMTIANTLANTYMERNFKTRFEATEQASTWLSQQLEDVRKNVESTQQKVTDMQKKVGIIGTDEDNNMLISMLDEVNKQLVQAESERIVREARYRVAMTENPELLASVMPGSTLQALKIEQADLQNQYAQLSSRYGDAFPRVVQLKAQLVQVDAALQAEITKAGEQMESEYKAAVRSENILRAEVEKQKQQAFKMNEDAIQFAILKGDLGASRDLYESMVTKLKEAGIMAGLKSTIVTIVDPAQIPTEKAEPHLLLNVALGLLAGAFGGICLAFALENGNETIRTPADVETQCALPSLGVIPALGNGNSRNGHRSGNGHRALMPPESDKFQPITIASPTSPAAEAYRSLRTTLLLASPGAPPKLILVTSALPGEGKTMTSINSAIVLAQKNRRVLLVDADLRRPNVHTTLGLSNNAGLSSALAGNNLEESYVSHPMLPTLSILPAGHRPPLPSELLDSDRMRELMARWRSEFDHVIIDTPPVLGLSDAVVLSTLADAVVMVVRAAVTGRQSVRRAREVLIGVNAKLAGALVNAVDLNSMDHYGYYGYYGKEYRHYYGVDEEKN
jgi:succinoglycan biosynthesis transport protein ExoP